jgi:hypothetical protein
MPSTLLVVTGPTPEDSMLAAVEAETWEEMVVEVARIVDGLPPLIVVDLMRQWLSHDGTEGFVSEMICLCGGTCGLTKVLSYQP